MKERELIEAIAALGWSSCGEMKGIGDDCAVIRKNSGTAFLLTMDTLIEGVHFDLAWHAAEKLARKSVSVNISDIAAMGGRAKHILLSLGFPSGTTQKWQKAFLDGLKSACNIYGCSLIGGDTVCSPKGVHITVTAIGVAEDDKIRYRHQAVSGDDIYVTGTLGNAAAGLVLCREKSRQKEKMTYADLVAAHLDPRARLNTGIILAESGLVHAMMDISDGLATDLAHICKASSVGAVVEAELLPAGPQLLACCRQCGWKPESFMLFGGEDYELLFTAPTLHAKTLADISSQHGISLYRVGKIVDGVKVFLIKDGEKKDISYQGYEHLCG